MIKISDRLRTVADMCRQGNVAADIGTDHGYLPIYLVQNNIFNKAVAMDLREGPLEKARKHISGYGLQDRICTRLSDGLESLKCGEADTITICGMGGRLIRDILINGMDKLTPSVQLIVSPQSEVGEFRHFLLENGFDICAERMVKEEGKFYFIMDCRISSEDDNNCYSDEAEYQFGKCLLEMKDITLYEYLQRELSVNQAIMSALDKKDESPALARRRETLEAEKSCIETALSYYD